MEKSKGIAECADGHKWAVTWHLWDTVTATGLSMTERVVRPPLCPVCGKKWKLVHPETN